MQLTCKICESNTREIVHPRFGHYRWCEKCDFIFKDEVYHVSKEEELRVYNSHQNSVEDPRYVQYFASFLEAAVFNFTSYGKVGLDFGSGPSPVLSHILETQFGYKMDVYDIYYAKEKSYVGKKYDLITSTEVIEHLSDPLLYFRLFFDLMKDDSVLAIMTLFHQNDHEGFLNWHYIRDRTHVSFYTPKTIEYAAEKTGLKVIYTDNVRYITLKKPV